MNHNENNETNRRSWRKDGFLLFGSFLLGLFTALLCGCATPNKGVAMPWSPTSDHVEGVVAPYQRIEELEKLEKEGPKASQQAQNEVSARLAKEYQTETDPLIRCQMIKTLGSYPTEAAATVLRHALADSNPEVRMVACEAWGRRGDAEALQRLGERVNADTNNDVRLSALRALGETDNPEAVQRIAPALEDSDPALQRRAVLALKEVSNQDFGNDVVRWHQWANNKPVDAQQDVSIAQKIKDLF